jgi:hypothetical protein
MLRGSPYLEMTVMVVPDEEWVELDSPNVDAERQVKLPFEISALQDFVDQPLGKVKEQLAAVIEKEAHLTPAEVFSMFENYEDDLVRILGFLPVHFLNEYGNLVEKTLQNPILAKVVGHVFNAVKKDAPRLLPPEVAQDMLALFLEFIEGLAPAEMIDRYRQFGSFDYLNFLLEGTGLALRDLGVDFGGLKSNLWEEFKAQQEPPEGEEVVTAATDVFRSPDIVNLVVEVMQLILDLLTLPTKLLVASAHAEVKSVVTARTELLDAVRTRLENIFDIVQQLRGES